MHRLYCRSECRGFFFVVEIFKAFQTISTTDLLIYNYYFILFTMLEWISLYCRLLPLYLTILFQEQKRKFLHYSYTYCHKRLLVTFLYKVIRLLHYVSHNGVDLLLAVQQGPRDSGEFGLDKTQG